MTVGTVAATAYLGVTVQASELIVHRTDRFETRRAATSVNQLVAENLWSGYRATLADNNSSLPGLRAYLTSSGYADQDPANPAVNNVLGGLGLSTNDAGNAALGDVEIESVVAHREDDPRSSRLIVTTVAVARRGVAGSGSNITERVTDVFSIEPGRWSGLDYVLLANNINCIMCHTSVDDARRVYPNGGFQNDFERARVGSIETFQFRDDPDSTIAGTLYLGGPAVDEHGSPITDWANFNLKGAELNGEGRLVEDLFGDLRTVDMAPADPSAPGPFGNLYTDYLDMPAPVDGELPDSFPLPFQDDGGYDVATGAATPDGAGNRLVDDNEFLAATASYQGSIHGGQIGVVELGDRVDTSAAASSLVAGNRSGLDAVTQANVILTGTSDNPIRIAGDVAIDGDLVISGPIEGTGSLWVRGNIYVRGDLEYADMVASGERVFGTNASGGFNALGMTAGGNIVIGDPFRPLWGEGGSVDGTSSAPWNFTLEEASTFNRREWIKTQRELPGLPVQVAVGTETRSRQLMQTIEGTRTVPVYEWRDTGATRTVPVFEDVQVGTREEPVYQWVDVSNGRTGEYAGTTRERVQVGTREVPVYERQQTGTREQPVRERIQIGTREEPFSEQVAYDPPRFDTWDETLYEMQTPMHLNPDYAGNDFVPRYYAFGEGDPVPIKNRQGHFDPATQLWVSEEIAFGWDESKLTLADPNDPSDPTLYPLGRPAAAIETLEPKGGWIASDVLEALIADALSSRDASEPFKVDATLYSANSIFGLVPDSPAGGTNGELRVQGSVLAADVGLLGPNGTELLYDPRGQALLDIRDNQSLGLRLLGAVPTARP